MAESHEVTARGKAWQAWIVTAVIAVAVARVAATNRVFNATEDEPIHIAAGYDWLIGRPYTLDIEHPPLSRILAAIPLYLAGIPEPHAQQWVDRGNELLNFGGRYVENLRLARLGNLLLLAVAIVAVWALAREAFGPAAALGAAALFSTLPPVLAHAGFAATDLAGTAFLPLSVFALVRWLDRPSMRGALLLGLAAGGGLLSKFSFILFFPCCAAIVLAAFAVRRRELIRGHATLPAAVVVAFLAVWAGYRFDAGRLDRANPRAKEMVFLIFERSANPIPAWLVHHVPVPAPLFINGLLEVKLHDERGHGSCLCGEYRRFGTWYYFPLVVFLKTPIPFLLLVPFGITRGRLEYALLPLAVLLPSMTSTINIGVRHVLPIYALLAPLAGYGLLRLWRWRAGKVAALVLVSWQLVSTTLAHPDYLAWFNEAAGPHPERIVQDSNIDWGQDIFRLVDFCRTHHINHLSTQVMTSVDPARIGLPPMTNYKKGVRGWAAFDEVMLCEATGMGLQFPELERHFVARVGKSIRMYYVP